MKTISNNLTNVSYQHQGNENVAYPLRVDGHHCNYAFLIFSCIQNGLVDMDGVQRNFMALEKKCTTKGCTQRNFKPSKGVPSQIFEHVIKLECISLTKLDMGFFLDPADKMQKEKAHENIYSHGQNETDGRITVAFLITLPYLLL